MSLASWLALAAVCISGAMSPGPSLAVIVRNTLSGGLTAGVTTAWSHACGVGVYALISALGLAAVISQSPGVFVGLRYAGAAFLVFLALGALRSNGNRFDAETEPKAGRGALDGLLISLLNPKIVIWFVALFGQFVQADSGLPDKLGMAGLAFVIDGTWYTIVAFALSWPPILRGLKQRAVVLDRVFGVVLLAVALRVVIG